MCCSVWGGATILTRIGPRHAVLIKAGQLKEAKLSVAQIREQHMLAINARKEGILLMDSIELQTARQTLSYVDRVIQAGEKSDSLLGVFDRLCEQVKFYERKLDHDTKQL